jgi:dolichol kinase
MLDQAGLRAHNRRVTNPRTVAHTPVYYRVRSVARVVTMLVVNSLWVAVFVGLILGAWLLAGSAAEWLIGVTK